MSDDPAGPSAPIPQVVARMRAELEHLDSRGQREFLATYLRTTIAIQAAVSAADFEDGEWVERWGSTFADLYFEALDRHRAGSRAARPWRLAFDADPDLMPLLHVLLGINAHINYDLPQALLAVISDEDFADTAVLARRRRDHHRIDMLLGARVAAEDLELSSHSARSLLDRALRPLNRAASRRFLGEAREKVWHNTLELQRARLVGPDAFASRLAELEVLSAARIADLLAPGQVLLKLWVGGFGVILPPPD